MNFCQNMLAANTKWPIKDSNDADFQVVYFNACHLNFFSGPDDIMKTTL